MGTAVSTGTGVYDLKKYTDEQFEHLEKLTNEKFRSRDLAFEEYKIITQRALELQAKEYERRLDALNGEAGRLRLIQANYIPREVFDAAIKELDKKVEVLTAVNLKGEGKTSWEKYIPWLIMIGAIIFAYFKPK